MIVSAISEATGLGESVLRLLLTIISAYFVALFYRLTLARPIAWKYASSIRNLYNMISGLGLSFFFNNISIIHSLITVTSTWLLMWFGNAIGNRSIGAALVFILNSAYLIIGYISTATDDYDIDWTMPQCVLCLRMIGFAMDYMDGAVLLKSQKPEEAKVNNAELPALKKESAVQAPPKESAVQRPPQKPSISFPKDCKLATLPSFFETIGYAYFSGAFLIGPQFSFTLYRKFITYTNYPDQTKPPSGAYFYALKSILLGALYLGVQQVGSGIFPVGYLLTKEWASRPFLERLFYMWAAGKFALTKYLGIWTLAEGSCALTGISFSGFDENGHAKWDGLANVEKWKFEFATSLTQIVSSFNTNTNLWVKFYIFKRLMFLNNKNFSSLASLFFLAIWHGTHAGYFLCFSLEFFDVEAEKRWSKRLSPYTTPLYDTMNKNSIGIQVLRRIHMFTCWLLQTSALHYAMIPFVLLRFDHSVMVLGNVYFVGHAVILALLLFDLVLPKSKGVKKVPEKLNNEIKINGDLSRDMKMNGHMKAH